MVGFILRITTDNDAFAGEFGPGDEIARILRALAVRIDNAIIPPGWSLPLYDAGGNRVGSARVVGDE